MMQWNHLKGVAVKGVAVCLSSPLILFGCYEVSDDALCSVVTRCGDNTVQECDNGVWYDRTDCDVMGKVCIEGSDGAHCEMRVVETPQEQDSRVLWNKGETPTYQIGRIPVDTSQCDPSRVPMYNEDWIADFEDGTLQAGNNSETFNGFITFNDGTANARMHPESSEDQVGLATTNIYGCSPSVMCFKNTQGKFTDWGASVGMEVVQDEHGDYLTMDFLPYRGVFFYALRLGGTPNLKVSFPDVNTHPAGEVCEPDGTEVGCFKDWSFSIVMEEENVWTPHEKLFGDLEVGYGWGIMPRAFSVEHVYGMTFHIEPNVDFDFCIDDIYLIR